MELLLKSEIGEIKDTQVKRNKYCFPLSLYKHTYFLKR
jgi:hypothetical protein